MYSLYCHRIHKEIMSPAAVGCKHDSCNLLKLEFVWILTRRLLKKQKRGKLYVRR